MTNSIEKYQHNFGDAYAAMLPTLADAMCEILAFFGCDVVYGVGGDFAANLIAGFEKRLEVVPASNEMHAGFCACGQAEITGLGVCLTTYTVGSLPVASAAGLAVAEKLPVIFISGAPGESEIGTYSIHHTIVSNADWRVNYDSALNAFRALGLRAERLQGARHPLQPNIAATRFFQLIAHAYLNKEPVFIEVPRDLVFDITQPIQLPASLDHLEQAVFSFRGAELIAAHIEEKLAQSNYPLIYAGSKVKLNAKLCEAIAAFCQKHQIPLATSWFAKGIFDEFHPLCLGAYNGVFSSPQARVYIEQKADYVLEVATSIYTQDTSNAFNTGTHKILHFDNKTLLKGTDLNDADLLAIFKHLAQRPLKTFTRTTDESSYSVTANNPTDVLDFHNLANVLNEVQSAYPAAFIYLPEIGNSYFASYSLKTRKSSLGRSWLANPWYAAMGTCIPYARAVCRRLKRDDSKDVAVVITGDGGFHFQLNELIHFQRERLNVLILYMRNDIFHLGKSGDATIYNCSDPAFDVQALIGAYGGRAKRCTTVGEFCENLTAYLAQPIGIFLLEIPARIDPQYQCNEIRLLNLYIQAKNGMPEAMIAWEQLCQNPKAD